MGRTVVGQVVDVNNRLIYPAKLMIYNGVIKEIQAIENQDSNLPFILPGFVDSHIHIESSMLIPSEFAKKAVGFGTISTVSDPHEIANVLGISGVKFMMDNGRTSPLKFNFGAPSCVPATTFETAGAMIDAKEVRSLLEMPEIKYLSEMMNFPGVIHKDPEVMTKITHAHELKKPIDGHAPGLSGDALKAYAAAGISTDHECFTLEEAREKAQLGMYIQIREGSAARNFEALHPIIKEFPERVMFCSDDKHPDDLLLGHINLLVKRAVALGYDLFDVLRAACVTPVKHYQLNHGLLQVGDPADFILVDDLRSFNTLETWIDGSCVFNRGEVMFESKTPEPINHFHKHHIDASQLKVPADGNVLNVIEAIDGQLITKSFHWKPEIKAGFIEASEKEDILKLVVVNRYQAAEPAIAFIRGFGLQAAAIASTVAHDSHNIIAVGTNDQYLADAINLLMESAGGLSFVNATDKEVLPLEIAGLMSTSDCEKVAKDYETLNAFTKKAACQLKSPYMTLSFMALLVIPSLKLSDKGLFDGDAFTFTPMFV